MYTHNQARYEFQQNLKTVAQSAQSKRARFQQTNFHVEYWSCSQVLAMQ